MRSKLPSRKVDVAKILQERIRLKGWLVYDPTEKSEEARKEGESELGYLRKVFALDCLWICKKAVCIAMMKNWQESLGAKCEHALATALGLRTIYLDDDDKEPKPKAFVSTIGNDI